MDPAGNPSVDQPYEVLPDSDERPSWRPILLSFLIHVLLVLILCLSIRATNIGGKEPERPVGIVLTDSDELQDPTYLDETQVEKVDPVEPQLSDSALPSEAAPEVESVTPMNAPGAGISIPEVELDAGEMTTVPTKQAKPRKLTKAELEQIAADQAAFAARQPKGPPASINVFGSGEISGQSFVFLLDRSASMGAGGLGVIQASQSELGKAIGRLENYHRFQIVGYHNQTVPMFEHKLLKATNINKQSVPNFISKLAAFGPTDHLMALLTALAYKPDAVIFMTDGGLPELNEGHLKRIKKAARGAQIHCIQFGRGPNPQTTNFMRLLAEQNEGSYQYVDVNRWNDDE